MAFVQGRDDAIRQPWMEEMTRLAADMKFEEAETIKKKVERLQRARQELQSLKDAFSDLQSFNFVIVLPSDASSRVRIVIVRGGAIVAFRILETATLRETLQVELSHFFESSLPAPNREWLYDEFCLVCTFMVKSLQSVQLIRFEGNIEDTAAAIEKRMKRSNSKRRQVSRSE
jgi:hypothetical protein